MQIEQEEQRQIAQEMAPFDENVIMKSPAKRTISPSISIQESVVDEQDVLF